MLADVVPCGGILRLSIQDTGEHVGLVDSKSLSEVMSRFSVKLAAFIPPAKQVKRNMGVSFPTEISTIRVVVFGLAGEGGDVGRILSDDGLFFQHPSHTEYDGAVPYRNPHYLLRPGSKMPPLDQLAISDPGTTGPAEVLNDVSKGRLMRLFDLAGAPGAPGNVRASLRLKSPLKRFGIVSTCVVCVHRLLTTSRHRHQLSALEMMSERETGVIEGAKFPVLWEKSTWHDGGSW